jgi:hypothetical protein
MVKIGLAVLVGWALVGRAADDELDKALEKAAAMDNYTFTATNKIEGMGGGGGGGGGGAPTVTIKIQKDTPWQVKLGEKEAYKKGETVVSKGDEGWKKVERPQGGGGGGNRPSREQMQLLGLLRLKGAHETLKEFGKKFKEVKSEAGEGSKCFSGELTAEAAKELGAVGGRGGGGGGGQGSQLEYTGSARIWVNGDGAVIKYEVVTEGKGKIRDRDVTIKRTQTVEISEVGSTKYDVPEEAMKALSD